MDKFRIEIVINWVELATNPLQTNKSDNNNYNKS